ncbi:hypothetical protein [Roseicella aerolata]|uniref:Ribbon-helix-helix protein CopG domain-containing protein n=1 Tax=Roseicella aerolata TaxID=2883479 RepID=A0A9X1IKW6_9PROT|nr:hypothetical protein [Roseicella aerolata]MCB4825498.1 hypothetical protein [Roseicella aerolata]
MTKAPDKPRFEMRLPPALADRIDRWRRDQPDLPNRAEAARRLMEIGLAAEEVHAPRRSPGEAESDA